MKRSPLLVIFITIFIDLVGFGIVIPVCPSMPKAQSSGATPQPGWLVVRFLLGNAACFRADPGTALG
jgi:hypothetical protein